MKTSEKRKICYRNYPNIMNEICEATVTGEYRYVDNLMQTTEDKHLLQYVITLLCDELILLTREDD